MKIIDNKIFECIKCGECCKWDGFVVLTPVDIERISEFLKLSESDFLNNFTKREQGYIVLINKRGKKECIFLKGNKCGIWKYKPEQCDKYPLKYEEKCPGFKKLDQGFIMSKNNSCEDKENEEMYKNLCKKMANEKNTSSFEPNPSIDYFLEDNKNIIKVSSLRELIAFERISNKHLIHKCTRDLWVIDSDKDGNLLIKRLFDNNGEPIKG